MKTQRRLGSDAPQVIAGLRGPGQLPETNLAVSKGDLLGMLDKRSADADHAPQEHTVVTRMVPIEQIDVSPYQPRTLFVEESIFELANSIAAVGLLTPIMVRPLAGRFQLIGGERRLRASTTIGHTHIRAEVHEVDDLTAMIMATADNEGSVDLTDFEKATAYQKIMQATPDCSLSALARKLSMNKGVLQRTLLMNELPEGVKAVLNKHPDLISKFTVKQYLEYAQIAHDVVVEVVQEMAEKSLGQQAGLAMIAARLSKKDKPEPGQEIVIKGVGALRLKGGRIELKFPRDRNPDELFAKVQRALELLADHD